MNRQTIQFSINDVARNNITTTGTLFQDYNIVIGAIVAYICRLNDGNYTHIFIETGIFW